MNTPEKVPYKIQSDVFATYASKNLYAFVCERSLVMARREAAMGMIVQLTALSAEKMRSLQSLLLARGLLITPAFPRRPESIFEGVEMPVTILISRQSKQDLHTSRISRFYTEERPTALNTLALTPHSIRLHGHRIGKFGNPLELEVFRKWERNKTVFDSLTTPASGHALYYQEACRYWVKACIGVPFFRRNGERISPPHGRTLHLVDAEACAFAFCVVNSTFFYWLYSAFSDCEHINDALIRDFRIPENWRSGNWITYARRLTESQARFSTRKTINTKQGHRIEDDEMDASKSKPIFDEIDAVLACHYGFSQEELDFIVNYDVKYRLGRGSKEEEG